MDKSGRNEHYNEPHGTYDETRSKSKRKSDDVPLEGAGNQDLCPRKKIAIALKAKNPDTQIAQRDEYASSSQMPNPLPRFVNSVVPSHTKQSGNEYCDNVVLYDQSVSIINKTCDLTLMPPEMHTIIFNYLIEPDVEFEDYTNQNEVWLYFLSLTSKKLNAICAKYHQQRESGKAKLISDSLTTYFAFYGHLSCLQFVYEHGCEWHKDACTYAATNGHLECLKYVHENGGDWDDDTCTSAAASGSLDCPVCTREWMQLG